MRFELDAAFSPFDVGDLKFLTVNEVVTSHMNAIWGSRDNIL